MMNDSIIRFTLETDISIMNHFHSFMKAKQNLQGWVMFMFTETC